MLNITTENSQYKLFLKNESGYYMYTQKSKTIILILLLFALVSCKSHGFRRIQDGLCSEWQSGMLMPKNWPLIPIPADTLVAPLAIYNAYKSYPSYYSDKIACLYYNGEYAVRLDSSFVLIPRDTIKERINEARFYVDSDLYRHFVDTDSIGYAMTHIPAENRYRFYILEKNFDYTRFKQDTIYRKFVEREKIHIFEDKESFVLALKEKDIEPIFENVEGWDPEPDSIKCVYDIQRAIRDRTYNVTSFRPSDKTILNYTYNAILNTFLPISKKEGKAIDQMKIIDYSNDTLYIFEESLEMEDFRSRLYVKSKTGLLEIINSIGEVFRKIEKIHNLEQRVLDRKYYDCVFEWGDLLTFLRKNWSTKNRAYAELTRIIIKDYKIKHIDKWNFEDIDIPIITKQ